MGASSWSYFVEYDQNPARALAALREHVFANGKYAGPGGYPKPLPMELLRARKAVDPFTNKVVTFPALSRREFERRYVKRPSSIAELLEIQAEDGTHSALDIARMSSERKPVPIRTVKRLNPFTGEMFDVAEGFRMLNPFTGNPEEISAGQMGYGGVCEMATAEQLRTAFGTEQPSRKILESKEDQLYPFLCRWSAICVTAWKRKQPDALFFCGISGD